MIADWLICLAAASLVTGFIYGMFLLHTVVSSVITYLEGIFETHK